MYRDYFWEYQKRNNILVLDNDVYKKAGIFKTKYVLVKKNDNKIDMYKYLCRNYEKVYTSYEWNILNMSQDVYKRETGKYATIDEWNSKDSTTVTRFTVDYVNWLENKFNS